MYSITVNLWTLLVKGCLHDLETGIVESHSLNNQHQHLIRHSLHLGEGEEGGRGGGGRGGGGRGEGGGGRGRRGGEGRGGGGEGGGGEQEQTTQNTYIYMYILYM